MTAAGHPSLVEHNRKGSAMVDDPLIAPVWAGDRQVLDVADALILWSRGGPVEVHPVTSDLLEQSSPQFWIKKQHPKFQFFSSAALSRAAIATEDQKTLYIMTAFFSLTTYYEAPPDGVSLALYRIKQFRRVAAGVLDASALHRMFRSSETFWSGGPLPS